MKLRGAVISAAGETEAADDLGHSLLAPLRSVLSCRPHVKCCKRVDTDCDRHLFDVIVTCDLLCLPGLGLGKNLA